MFVYVHEQRWEADLRSTYRMSWFWQINHLFRWSSFWSCRLCKQAKLSHLGHRKAARIHWKADAPKTSHCLLPILIQRHNWAIFLRKWARRGLSLSGHVERIFVHKKLKRGILETFGFNRTSYTVFQDCIIRRRADVVWPPRSCNLIPMDYYLWGAVKDKCYADKPETIDALKDNIREAIGKIQLHTIDNVLKNLIDREIIFHY